MRPSSGWPRRNYGQRTVERDVNLSELSFADEVFLCGTAAEVTPVTEIDRRPVGEGVVGPVTQELSAIYAQVVHCLRDGYRRWCEPAYGRSSEHEPTVAERRSASTSVETPA